jgi:hypothetical protein
METGWLIEKHIDGVLCYIAIEFGVFGWTADNSVALRFSRKTDADKFFDVLLVMDDFYEGARVAEHGWAI